MHNEMSSYWLSLFF